ncbi:Cluap1 [Symbiodinium natans]|uniref:Cluap1 protein n=1 Tax=Symbiodinium natans TaxID=878477 RepID=A0A812S0M1_9DINO|nr:Cluap1 [Symbiodinium natans]
MSVWLRYTTLVGGSEPWEFAIDVFEDMLLAFEKTAFVYKNSVNKAWLIGNPPQLRATHKLLLDEAGGRPRCPGSAALVGQVAAITHFTGFAARGAWAAALSSLEDLQAQRLEADRKMVGSAMTSCTRSEKWPAALVLCCHLRAESVETDIAVANAAMSALGHSGHWTSALDVLEDA